MDLLVDDAHVVHHVWCIRAKMETSAPWIVPFRTIRALREKFPEYDYCDRCIGPDEAPHPLVLSRHCCNCGGDNIRVEPEPMDQKVRLTTCLDCVRYTAWVPIVSTDS